MKQILSTMRFMAMILTMSVCLVGCGGSEDDKETPTNPTNPETPTTTGGGETIPISGGTITKGDITITFPSGTFSSDTKVTITDVKSGDVDGNNELSPYYLLDLSAGVRKSFKIAFKMKQAPDNDKVKMLFITSGWISSEGCVGPAYTLVDTKYEKDSYVAEISAMDNPDETGKTTVCVGLASYITYEGEASARTRADSADNKSFKLSAPDISMNAQKEAVYNKLKSDWIPAAIKKINDLGFRSTRTIPYIVKYGMGTELWGEHVLGKFSKDHSVIYLNADKLFELGASGESEELQKTFIHETLHFFQYNEYDPRFAATINLQEPTTSLLLDEATAVWSERFYGNKLSKLTSENLWMFIASINPEIKDIHNYVVEKKPTWWNKDFQIEWVNKMGVGWETITGWDKRYENVGYGMSALIEYLSQKYKDGIVIDMYKKKKSSSTPTDTKGFVEEIAKAKGLNIFTQSAYKDFVEALGLRKLYPDPNVDGVDFSNLVQNRVQHDTIGVTKKSITKPQTVYFTNYSYGYGALIENISINRKNFKDMGFDNTSCIVEQTTEGLKTWVYGYQDKAYYLLGELQKGSKMDISKIFKKVLGAYANQNLYFVTIPNDFKTSKEILSRLVVSVKQDTLFVDPHELKFEAKGGTKSVKVETNLKKLTYDISDESWISVKNTSTGIDVSASANTSQNGRKGTITIYALNDAGEKTNLKETISIEQKGASSGTGGDYDFSKCKYITIEMTVKAHFTGVWDSSQNDVNIVVKFPENFWITPNYLADSPATKTTVSYSGKGAHMECFCENDTTLSSWMGNEKLQRYYKVTLDIDDIVSGKITNLTAECNYDDLNTAIEALGGNVEHGWSKEKVSASNIPLPGKSGSAKGNKSTGTTINSCTREHKSGWMDYKYSLLPSDDYEIVVNFK